ncbi:hypothetical protein CW751_00020 [Brumimicrobium salinarum]|uniref:Uncharacterized protein n=1 Tax=Brumimicrobium salinarum TaxID=2058658 RepID=A0A2I0R5A0_9FLAO|nr:hypothetical protein [Brumimicrobium salinarum]PKR81762.1 hypothetical protein CW751_00020 [Brumimicrobium salinarum]
MSEEKCLNEEMLVNVSKRRPKFKAGTELANSVNMVDVDSSKDVTEDSEIIKISIRLTEKTCVEVCD